MSSFAVASFIATPVAALMVGGLITVTGWWFFFGVFGPAVVGALLGESNPTTLARRPPSKGPDSTHTTEFKDSHLHVSVRVRIESPSMDATTTSLFVKQRQEIPDERRQIWRLGRRDAA